MTWNSPFAESVWLVIANLETQLVVSVVFPAIVIGLGVKAMRRLGKEKDNE
jgi:membrane protein implicated in regulation of membrane protease activity